jgi:tRNA 2-thiouridine synthesizing protein C
MDGMRTTVIFIEDGVFALHGTHDVPENDKIFNIQEMIAVTRDVECLRYAVHSPSLDERGIAVSDDFSPVRMITNADLAGILFGKESGEDAPVVRMIFF